MSSPTKPEEWDDLSNSQVPPIDTICQISVCSNDDDANTSSRPFSEHACALSDAAHSQIEFTEQQWQQEQNICQSESAHETLCALLLKLAMYDAAVSLNRMQIHPNDDLVSDQTSLNVPCWTNSVSQSDEPSWVRSSSDVESSFAFRWNLVTLNGLAESENCFSPSIKQPARTQMCPWEKGSDDWQMRRWILISKRCRCMIEQLVFFTAFFLFCSALFLSLCVLRSYPVSKRSLTKACISSTCSTCKSSWNLSLCTLGD